MATPTNFYKNSAYAYAREFDLSSVLDNLHGTYKSPLSETLIACDDPRLA
jgi:hypothetical protein